MDEILAEIKRATLISKLNYEAEKLIDESIENAIDFQREEKQKLETNIDWELENYKRRNHDKSNADSE